MNNGVDLVFSKKKKKIAWIWAFFFLLAGLGKFFGPPQPCLPFWAHKQKRCGFGWIVIEGPNQPGQDTLFHPLFWEMVLSCFPNHQSEIMIDAYLIALLNDLELDFHILVDES